MRVCKHQWGVPTRAACAQKSPKFTACLSCCCVDPCPPADPSLLPRAQVRKFAAEQYAQNGIHLHPLTTPQQLEKLPDGRLKFTAAKRTGGQVGTASLSRAVGKRRRLQLPATAGGHRQSLNHPMPGESFPSLVLALQSSDEETFVIECDHVLAATGVQRRLAATLGPCLCSAAAFPCSRRLLPAGGAGQAGAGVTTDGRGGRQGLQRRQQAGRATTTDVCWQLRCGLLRQSAPCVCSARRRTAS